MRPREEGLLLFLLVAAALAAAFSFRPRTEPEHLHDPGHAARFRGACAELPALAAVRVRVSGDAAARLETRAAGRIARVLSAERVRGAFRYGRLLGAAPPQLEAVLAALEQGIVPPLPPHTDTDRWFQDARGPYACDVLLKEGAEPEGLAAIRESLPGARLSGEPVAREAERGVAAGMARPLLCALAALGGWIALRRGRQRAERRLLAAVVAVALAGLVGGGMDAWSLLGVIVTASAPRGRALLAGAVCLPFPSLAIRRLGVVLVAGALALARRPPGQPVALPAPAAPPRRGGALALAVVLLAGAVAAWRLPLPASLPEAVRGEASVLFVPPAEAAARAGALRAEGNGPVVGDTPPLPPAAGLEARRLLVRIHREAERLAATATPDRAGLFREVAEAAAVDRMHLPSDLRARLRTRDGAAVLWVLDPLPGVEKAVGAARYRADGMRQLAREARAAALALFLLHGVFALASGGRAHALAVGGRAAAVGAGFLVLALVPWPAPAPADMLAPVLVAAAVAPGAAALPALAVAALAAPALFAAPACALVACVAVAWLSRRR